MKRMKKMFWCVEIGDGKPHTERIKKSYHISHAALDLTTGSEDSTNTTQVWLRSGSKSALLATLSDQIPQAHLDHAFETGEQVTFYIRGVGTVYLSGYYIPNVADLDELLEENQTNDMLEEQMENTVDSGVTMLDIKGGSGPAAKLGDNVTIYYQNQLESNGTVIGQVQTGDGFTFELGSGCVIAAWNIGIVGMQMGAERKLICEPKVAYGVEGIRGIIPPNAKIISVISMQKIENNT